MKKYFKYMIAALSFRRWLFAPVVDRLDTLIRIGEELMPTVEELSVILDEISVSVAEVQADVAELVVLATTPDPDLTAVVEKANAIKAALGGVAGSWPVVEPPVE